MGQDAILCLDHIWLVEVLTSGNEIKRFAMIVVEMLSQVFSIMFRLILYFP